MELIYAVHIHCSQCHVRLTGTPFVHNNVPNVVTLHNGRYYPDEYWIKVKCTRCCHKVMIDLEKLREVNEMIKQK